MFPSPTAVGLKACFQPNAAPSWFSGVSGHFTLLTAI